MPTRTDPSDALSALERLKEGSDYLTGDLPAQLADGRDHVDDDGYQLLKFAGMYQQDDRDLRRERRRAGLDRAYSFMVRTKLPGGALGAAQYLAHDALADRYGNGTLRFTTRQGIQLHGVLKGDIRAFLADLHDSLVTTLGACGDVVRNVMASPAPIDDGPHRAARDAALALERHFLPRADSYVDLWLDGERTRLPEPARDRSAPRTAPVDATEPIYGRTYLPRKFKIGVALPGDNSVDVWTQDVGVIPILDGDDLLGYDLTVGGGLGMSHTRDDTFPRLADRFGFVPPERLLGAVEAIVAVQRDEGERGDRAQARLKYLIHRWGLARFRAEVETRLGWPLEPWREVGPLELVDFLGWHPQGDGRWFYGVPVENGRIVDRAAGDPRTGVGGAPLRLRSALRAIAETFGTELRITPQHNLLVTDLAEGDRARLEAILGAHAVPRVDQISNARRFGIACPALPTCGLALAESERALPAVLDRIEADLAELGLADEPISIRMTGCPNGCARPYSAEIAFVGRTPGRYGLFVGGAFDGDRLAEPFADLVPQDELAPRVRELLELWAAGRAPGERFGDWSRRTGLERLRAEVGVANAAD